MAQIHWTRAKWRWNRLKPWARYDKQTEKEELRAAQGFGSGPRGGASDLRPSAHQVVLVREFADSDPSGPRLTVKILFSYEVQCSYYCYFTSDTKSIQLRYLFCHFEIAVEEK